MANLGIIEIYGNEGWVDAEVKMAENTKALHLKPANSIPYKL